MKTNKKLGVILTSIGALVVIIGTFVIFMTWYEKAMHMETAEPGCELLLKWIMPALADLSILAGVGYVMSAYGFFNKKDWAFPVAVFANVLALQGSWFINVPFMAGGAPPIYFIIFWPTLILYFLIMRLVGKLSWGRILLGMLTGMGFILCFMNGIASWSRILTIGDPIFVFVQRLSWFSSIGWGIVTIGILIRPKEWMRIVGIGSGFLQVLVGVPIAYETTIELGRFSLFTLAPIISLVVLVLFLSPSLYRRMTGSQDETSVAITD